MEKVLQKVYLFIIKNSFSSFNGLFKGINRYTKRRKGEKMFKSTLYTLLSLSAMTTGFLPALTASTILSGFLAFMSVDDDVDIQDALKESSKVVCGQQILLTTMIRGVGIVSPTVFGIVSSTVLIHKLLGENNS